jgi:hypothetical protein
MTKNERRRLTDRTILILNGLLTTTGNRMAGENGEPGGIPVVVPDQTARDIYAIAYDVLQHKARKARLDQAQVTA